MWLDHLRTMSPHRLERLTVIQLQEAADLIARLRLTDEEREAVAWFAGSRSHRPHGARTTIRGLLERMR
jgi:hypothetical protein